MPYSLTQCEVPEASQQLVKVERLCGSWAGPDSLGTGSVSGFGPSGWWLKLSPRCNDLLTCWLCVSVCICVHQDCLAPCGLPDGLEGDCKQNQTPMS